MAVSNVRESLANRLVDFDSIIQKSYKCSKCRNDLDFVKRRRSYEKMYKTQREETRTKMASASGGQDQSVRFHLILEVQDTHNSGVNLRAIQRTLTARISEFRRYLTDTKNLYFLHLCEIHFRKEDSSLSVEFEVFTKDELEKFQKASKDGTLVGAFRAFSSKIELFRHLTPMEGFKFKLYMPNDVYAIVSQKLAEREHLKMSSKTEVKNKEVLTPEDCAGESDVDSRQKTLANPANHGSSSEIQSGGAMQMDSSKSQQEPIKFELKLKVAVVYNNGKSLKLIRNKLHDNIKDLCKFMTEKQNLPFLHITRFTFNDKDPAIYVELHVCSIEELDELKLASSDGQLSNAFTRYAYLKFFDRMVYPNKPLRLFLQMPHDTYSDVSTKLSSAQREHKDRVDTKTQLGQNIPIGKEVGRDDNSSEGKQPKPALQGNWIERKFMVCLWNPNNHYVGKVVIQFEKQKDLNEEKLDKLSHGIYGGTVKLPVSCLGVEVTYKYVAYLSHNRLKYLWEADIHESRIQHIDLEEVVQRDFWSDFDLESLEAHLKNIIFCDKIIKNDVMQIESLLKRKKLCDSDCETLLEGITMELTLNHKDEAALCAVVIGNVLKNLNLYTIGSIVRDKARLMLSELMKHRLDDFPSSCGAYLPATCQTLSQISLGKDYSLLVAMAECCPFLNEEHFNKWMEGMKKESGYYYREKDIIAAQSLTMFVVNRIRAKVKRGDQIHQCQKLFHFLITRWPLRITFNICKSLQECGVKEGETILMELVETVLNQTCTEVQNGQNITLLLDLWTIVSANHCCMVTYAEKFNWKFIVCLKTCKLETVDLVENIALTKNLFRSGKLQTELLKLLGTSANPTLHAAFLKVLKLPNFTDCLNKEGTISTIEKWFQMLTGTHLVSTSDNRLQKLYWNLFEILRITPEPACATMLNRFTSLTITYLERLDVMEVLQSLQQIESVCPPKHLDMCEEHLKAVLQTNSRKLQLHQVLDTMKGRQGSIVINSRVAATVLCFVLDTSSSFQNPDNTLECLKTMSTKQFVWNAVKLACGRYLNRVHQCSTYQKGMDTISSILKMLSDHKIAYEFFSNGKITDGGVKQLLYLNKCYEKMEIERLLKENQSELEFNKDKITVIQTVIKVIQEKLKKELRPENFDQYTEQINNMVDRFDKINLSDFHSKYAELFQKQEVYIHCKNCSNVIMSQVYWNAYKNETSHCDDAKHSDKDDNPSFNVECTRFACRLLETTNNCYIENWKKIQSDKKINMTDVGKMFSDCFQNVSQEIEWADKHLQHKISDDCKRTLKRLGEIKTMIRTVDAMHKAVKAFDLNIDEDTVFNTAITSFRQLLKEDPTSLTFQEVETHLDVVFKIAEELDETTTDVLEMIGNASSLSAFLKKIIDEDIRNLIDAVEDISEQRVSESTVSALIEVKRFFKPILISVSGQNSVQLLQSIRKQVGGFGKHVKLLPSKIEDCMNNLHNLISLYNNVANRGEQTKHIIHNIVNQGNFQFVLAEGEKQCDFKASYTHNKTGQNVVHPKSAVSDFRSRALLLMNSERQGQEKGIAELEKFVNAINVCLDVSENICALHLSGNMKYPEVNKTEAFNDLQDLLKSLEVELQSWNEHLKLTRDKFYLMNFVQGTHLHTLGRFLKMQNGHRKVDIILKFIHPEMNAEMLGQIFNESHIEFTGRYEDSMNIGRALTACYEKLDPFKRGLKTTERNERKMTEIVENGKLLVARIDEANVMVVKTLLALYLRTSNRLPEPSEVLLCSRETAWSDVELLLGRCLGAYRFFGKDTLYCIANVEVLPNKIHFKLVEVLKNLDKTSNFLLSIICQGTSNHPFIDEFYENLTTIRPLSDETVWNIFSEVCPKVHTFTSDCAGLGKSTTIAASSKHSKRAVKTIHVSGPIKKRKLIDRLHNLNLRKEDSLHIDIGYIDNPLELDLFLFELIILNYVIADGEAMDLPTTHVYIEIANTINNTLRDSLQTAVSFKRKHKTWKNFNDFIVSKDVNSPVQVVCQYLYSLEKGVIDRTDIAFSGDSCVKALPTKVCRYLMKKYIHFCETFIRTNICMNVLADQLKKMSNSGFFKTSRIRDMTGPKSVPTIKSSMVKALLDVSSELASRSVDAYRNTQQHSLDSGAAETPLKDLAPAATQHVEHMIKWEESNHLIYIFHNQNIQTISPMYRQIDLVPVHVKELFESQMKRSLCDFKTLKQNKLQDILQKVARTNPASLKGEELEKLSEDYALTPDNLLKMVLIILRIKARVPVLVMGETGCGKTSLIRYLAGICEVPIDVVSIHAGVEESAIINKILDNNRKALQHLNQEHWVFLDEINTSEYIGLISDFICHHKCLGKTLAPNLVFLAACNPYRLRSSNSKHTSGLKGKVKTDELSRLVYRVLPLPENLVDYVWDFGSLTENDEKMYIARMVGTVFDEDAAVSNLFVDLLSMSQKFSRKIEETTSSVSLRDIQRCKILTEWFWKMLMEKKSKISSSYHSFTSDKKIPALILALSHCYLSRFSYTNIRQQYIEKIEKVCATHAQSTFSVSVIQKIIKEEQRDILSRMDLPPGTALNTALRENVFVLLVCILNRIPIFVVGKPGCSKSLSMQVIKSNLRGKDSKDEFFRLLPQLYCVSFQGSESSTSDGILKVFEKAEKYQEANSTDDVLSVVILDEIGLAEISRFNPLKVLHNLLEPDGQSRPNIAVVGISNWSLDASKMNRAIHLSRPEMDEGELKKTAKSISDSFEKDEQDIFLKNMHEVTYSFETKDIKVQLEKLARSYIAYITALRFENFHGLRDYYSLIKYIARELSTEKSSPTGERFVEVLLSGVQRNFGGLPSERETLMGKFDLQVSGFAPVLQLVMENVTDPLARHLMIITSGESVLGIIERSLKQAGRNEREILFGSKFEEDLTDDYNYRMLSRIILCMEQGLVLILKDLESIYGSLYDMLNKNYTEIGKKKHCRVALGAYSNPICHVHEYFRCIVLIDETQLDFTDPPFLNRFEKQNVQFSDIITVEQQATITEVEEWIKGITQIKGRNFTAQDCIPIYGIDMVASYVLQKDKMKVRTEDIHKDFLWIIKPESVIRMKCSTNESTQREAELLEEQFFNLPLHDGISGFLKCQAVKTENGNSMTIIFTNSNIHSRSLYIATESTMQVEKLGAFKSEKQLSNRLQTFWLETDTDILFVQCSAIDDEKHIMLAKSVIERNRREFLSSKLDQSKSVYLIVHLDKSKGRSKVVSQINFLSGWQLVMLDSLESPSTPLPQLCRLSLYEAVMAKRPMDTYIKDQLFWTFTRIKYARRGRDVDSINIVLKRMKSSDSFIYLVEEYVCSWISASHSEEQNKNWQERVACDPHALDTSLTLVDALEKHICKVINKPLSKFIYQMEVMGILDSFFVEDDVSTDRRKAWRTMLTNEKIFSISGLHDEHGPETYECQTEDLALKMPFSLYIFKCIETTREEFMNSVIMLQESYDLEKDDDLPQEVMEALLLKQEIMILQKIENAEHFIYKNWMDDYIDDFCNLISIQLCTNLDRLKRCNVIKWILKQKVTFDMEHPSKLFTALHTAFWSNMKLFEAPIQLFDVCQSGVLLDDDKDWIDSIILEVEVTAEDMDGDMSASETNAENSKKMNVDLDVIYNRVEQNHSGESQQLLCGSAIDNIVDGDSESKAPINEVRLSDVTLSEKEIESSECNDDISRNLTEDSVQYRSDKVSDTNLKIVDDIPSEAQNRSEISLIETDDSGNSDFHLLTGGEEFSASCKLVDVLCKKMLPTDETVDHYGGLLIWQRKVNVLLRLSANVSDEPSSLHNLRFCNDITSEILLPDRNRNPELEEIAEFLKQGKKLDSKLLFNLILDFLNDPGHQKGDVCQRMFSNYLMRCISLDPETKALDLFLHAILENKIPDNHLSYMKLPLSTVLKSESNDVFVSLLKEDIQSEEEEVSILIPLDECVKILNENDRATPLANLIVDIIQENFEEMFTEDIEETDINALFLDGQKGLGRDFGLGFLSAVACCKTFISASFLKDGVHSVESLSAILPALHFSEDKHSPNSSLCWCLLKFLGLKHPLAKLWLRVKEIKEKSNTFREFEWLDDTIEGCTEMCPLKAQAPDEICSLVKLLKNTSELSSLSEKLRVWFTENKNAEWGLISVYGAAVQYFYLPKLYKNTEDTKNMQARVILDEAKQTSLTCDANLRLLKRILGAEDFVVADFKIDQGSSATDFYLSSVLISLFSLLCASVKASTGADMPVLAKCLQNPRDVKNLYLPGSVTGKSTNDTLHDVVSKTVMCTCTCGVRLCIIDSGELVCSYCGKGLEVKEKVTDLSTECDSSASTGFVQTLDGINASVRSLPPVVYHILSILTNGCLLGSVALGNASMNELEDIGVPEHSTEYLWTRLEKHWHNILLLLNVNECILQGIFQAIFLETRNFLCKDMSQLITEMNRDTWEETFVSRVENVISNRYQFLQDIFDLHKKSAPSKAIEVEGYVREFNITESNTECKKATHEALFRISLKPSMENFLYEFEKQKENFVFLQLVLQTYKDLSLPRHILAIVQWHMFVVSKVSYIMKRDTCFNITVTKFLHQTDEDEERDKRLKRFSIFKKAWDVVKENLTESALFDKRFHKESILADCLILDEKSVIFTALQQLVRIQNQFLDKALAVSHVCKATQFLCRNHGESMIQSFDITKVTTKQLVDFTVNWEDCLASDSQSHCMYGRQIVYDFPSIEKFLAVHLLNEKTYINLGDTLPRIVFSDEMYRNFASLVAELRVCIKQTALPKQTVEVIHSNHEKDPNMSSELLTHLGILMALMKKTKGGNPELPLVDYAANWEKLLTRALPPSLLPSPANCIKLCHVVSLHEVLEELTASSIAEGLEGDFKQRLDSDMEKHLSELVGQNLNIAELALGVLKRFVFRCLSVRDAEPKIPVKRFISDESFWPAGVFIDGEIRFESETVVLGKVIPDGLMVSHIYSAVTFLDDEIEKNRTRELNMSKLASFKTKEIVSTSSRGKRNPKKKAMKSRNF